MKHKISRLMAYVYMPLIFSLLGYVVIAIAASPQINMLQSIGGMIIANNVPSFNTDLKSAFEPAQQEDNKDTIDKSTVTFPDRGTHYANITCEKIGLNAPVYFDDTNAILRVGVGNYPGSFIPGYGRTILLSAHNTSFFKPLQNIEVGDIVIITTNYGVYEYKVNKTEVIDKDVANSRMNEWLSSTQEQLIMYTCYPFHFLSTTKTDRWFVYADKISGPDVK